MDSVPEVVDSQKLCVKQANEKTKRNRKHFMSIWKSSDLEILYFLGPKIASLFLHIFFFQILKNENAERPPREDKIIYNPAM